MNSRDQFGIYRSKASGLTNASFMSRVYLWMVIGLALSGAVAFQMLQSPELIYSLLANKLLFWGIIILQLGAVVWLSARVSHMSVMLATSVYLGYSILTGITFSIVLFAFTKESIAQAFLITSFSFLGLSVFGFVTKRDLGPIGSFCMMGLFGIIGLMLLGFLFPSILSNSVQMAINVCGVVIFAGLTAYDTQKIKNYNTGVADDMSKKIVILGALNLYLDFINLFLFILNLMGNRK